MTASSFRFRFSSFGLLESHFVASDLCRLRELSLEFPYIGWEGEEHRCLPEQLFVAESAARAKP